MTLSDLDKQTLARRLIEVIEEYEIENPDLDDAKTYIEELEEALTRIEEIANRAPRLF